MTRLLTSPVVMPVPVILGSMNNAYGLVRSLGEVGIRSIIADADRGPATFSRYVSKQWVLPSTEPTRESEDTLLACAKDMPSRPLVFPTSESWVVAILRRRPEMEQRFLLPFGKSETIQLTLTKTAMHRWCLEHGIRVPEAGVFKPGDHWEAFLRSAERHLPIIVKPETKGVGDETLGFIYQRFASMDDLLSWGKTQGPDGPPTGVLYQQMIPGPVLNLLSYQGYRTADGRTYMGGYRKIRETKPHHGCATAAYIAADEESKQAALDLLDLLRFEGFFDAEFKRDERTGLLYFIEINPRPGMLNYGTTVQGINLPWLALADKAGLPLPEPKIVVGVAGIWTQLADDFVLNVLFNRTRGYRLGLREWFRSFRGHRFVHSYFNPKDPAVAAVALLLLLGQSIRRIPKFLRGLVSSRRRTT